MTIASVGSVALGLLLAAGSGTCPEAKIPESPWVGTPLHQAIRHNDVRTARRLMTAATVNERDSFGNTPLVAALTPSASLEPAGVVDASKAQTLIQAERTARQAIVSALLAKEHPQTSLVLRGPTADAAGCLGISPSVDVGWRSNSWIEGRTVNAADDSGTTALMLAARRGKKELVSLLLSKRADPAIKNCHDDAASLAKFGGFPALAEKLATHRGKHDP